MSTSVGTKAQKKQSSLSESGGSAEQGALELELSLLTLESACARVMESRFADSRNDTEALYWQQRLKNIATPISLALVEHKGPRRFHYHYRHREDDESVLHPVLEPSPLVTLAHVCEEALKLCEKQLVGIRDEKILATQHMLEKYLRNFLMSFNKYKAEEA